LTHFESSLFQTRVKMRLFATNFNTKNLDLLACIFWLGALESKQKICKSD